MREDLANPFLLVVHDGGDRRIVDAPVDCDDRQPLGRKPRDRLVDALDARKDQPVASARAQHVGDLRLLVEPAVGVREDRQVAALGERILDAADDRREDRIGDVGNHDPDGPRAVRPERVGGGVWVVVERAAELDDLVHDLH